MALWVEAAKRYVYIVMYDFILALELFLSLSILTGG